jgi:hypothetical protein
MMSDKGSGFVRVHLFRGTGRVFGCSGDAAGVNLPARFGPWHSFKTFEMNRGDEPRPRINIDDCLGHIEQYGFHMTDAHVRITESALR